ncbi:hypothetical protein Cantr_01924 [Candida viswanathii]|uniref:Nuclear distribution protein nudE 1 n=1 Tax=Candida viswanathii TaxID=5486 RepID=A0A367YK56_9ASCO|nr:hypothetical protein Cantr_01924 [Candida viswanathii]
MGMTSTELKDLPKEDLIEKILELEAGLSEFQESSKELEKALEDELQELENSNTQLVSKLNAKQEELARANAKLLGLTSEINTLHESTSAKLYEKDEMIHNLTSQLVKTEIINDTMESDDRIKSSKFEVQQRFNNDLLERLAMLESDYERERKLNVEKQLHITNYQNQIKDLQKKIDKLENGSDTEHTGDILMLSIREMLKSTPPPNKIKEWEQQKQSNLKKSDSLRKLKTLTMEIETFIGNFSTSKKSPSPSPSTSVLKSSSTTQLNVSNTTDRSHISSSGSSSNSSTKEKRISYSKRFLDLPSIKGSPTPSKRSSIEKSKSSKNVRM